MRATKQLLERAKALRREMTPAEARLWYHLRARRLHGVKFVRQVPVKPFVADFVARAVKLVIEVDGDTHGGREWYDSERTALLRRRGYRVIRFTNGEVMGNEGAVLEAIVAAVVGPPLPDPLPACGEREKNA